MATNVEKLVAKFNEELGEGTIHTGNKIANIRRMPFEVPMANYVSFGGLHIGRVNELVGGFSSLKSYLAYDMIGKFQRYDWANNEMNAFTGLSMDKHGKITPRLRAGYRPAKKPKAKRAMLGDIEGTYTKEWGERFGIDNDTLLRVQPDSPAKAVDMAAALLMEEEISLAVYDSASILEMDDEFDKSMEDHTMGSNTRFWSRSIRKIMRSMNGNPSENNDATFIIVNSVYSKVGMVMGNPEVIRNGEQLKLAKSLSLHVRGLAEIPDKKSGEMLGRNVAIKCIKNKGGAQGRSGNFFYAYVDTEEADQYSTDTFNQYVDLGVKYEMITRSGASYAFEGTKARGMDNFVALLKGDEVFFAKLKARIDKHIIHAH